MAALVFGAPPLGERGGDGVFGEAGGGAQGSWADAGRPGGKLYVTRQAVSRWERGEVVPGIDMVKLIAAVTGEPLAHLLEWPEHYCDSCGMWLTSDDCGTEAGGAQSEHYCKWCYEQGKYTYETTMEAMIEDCAPRLAASQGMSLDEAVSLMGAILPNLERWRDGRGC